MKFATLEGRRIAVWGCGREGRAALAALHRHLPRQVVTLFCREAEAAALAADPRVTVATQAPDADTLAAFDHVIKSPGISIYKPEIGAAQARGTVFTSGTALWFGENPDARVIAITGTKGKSTTSAMTAHIARTLGLRTALAGNIGLPLLELDGQTADLWVVELSSFQTGEAGPVDVGVVLNLYEEHLDWHGSRERYFNDKLKLAAAARTLVANAGHAGLMARTAAHPQRVTFGAEADWHVRGDALWHGQVRMAALADVLGQVPGRHNWLNACAALTALDTLYGFDADTAQAATQALASFHTLPHRLQRLGERGDRLWINDSISTTPEASRAALESLPGHAVTLIVGGFDRGLDWSGFARFVDTRPGLRLVVQGANGPRIAQTLRDVHSAVVWREAVGLDDAVAVARRISATGDAIVLSPGAPSFDQFRNYAERGRHFAELAGFDGDRLGRIAGLGIA
ncbi:MAG TPA: UDP-N-acetylmuramoyl-L-alanine--D-glutamate ligase [Rhodanobacteraceae bacterium]